jgi:hypothetical protein
VSVASPPASTVWLFGCVVIFGAETSGGTSGDAGGSLGLAGDGGDGVPGAWKVCAESD